MPSLQKAVRCHRCQCSSWSDSVGRRRKLPVVAAVVVVAVADFGTEPIAFVAAVGVASHTAGLAASEVGCTADCTAEVLSAASAGMPSGSAFDLPLDLKSYWG